MSLVIKEFVLASHFVGSLFNIHKTAWNFIMCQLRMVVVCHYH